MNPNAALAEHPVIRDLRDFDPNSGSFVERLFFNHRAVVVAVCLIITVALGYQALGLRLNASFDRMIPTKHTYIVNYQQNKAELAGLGNTLRVAVEATKGTIF